MRAPRLRCDSTPASLVLLALAASLPAAELAVLPEFQRPDPSGAVLAIDRSSISAPFRAPRGGYFSFHLVAKVPEGGAYALHVPAGNGLEIEVSREWFHRLRSDKSYYPDALIPVKVPYRSRMPEPDNQIAGQTAQAFWVDVWIPAETKPGPVTLHATLETSGGRTHATVTVTVLPSVIPPGDAVVIDHNSYGSSWLVSSYPGVDVNRLIHAHHRIFYEHRGVFHQLGYGHGGKVGPEFAPELAGEGRTRRIASWDAYDRHYGPLFDGSAFRGTRRGPKPIPFAYLPVNPEWPASFLWWGEPGYETEFVNVVSAMERHFREKGWTQTRLELFFNHKKRYKSFPWDGDESRFATDYPYYREYARLLRKAVPADTPVQFVFRADVSWRMEEQLRELAGIVNYWVAGAGDMTWFPEAPKMLKARGDIVFIYGGTPAVTLPSARIAVEPFRAWLYGADGFVRWQTVAAGSDPWARFNGGGETLVYPGARFGIPGPIPSLRLKLQRNVLQDLALLDALSRRGIDARHQAAQRLNGSRPADWWQPRPKLLDTPPEEWSNADLDDNLVAIKQLTEKVDAGAWKRVREWLYR